MIGTPRLVTNEVDPASYRAVLALEKYVQASGLPPRLLNLIRIRARVATEFVRFLSRHAHPRGRRGG